MEKQRQYGNAIVQGLLHHVLGIKQEYKQL